MTVKSFTAVAPRGRENGVRAFDVRIEGTHWERANIERPDPIRDDCEIRW
jgi:hypothetical protein